MIVLIKFVRVNDKLVNSRYITPITLRFSIMALKKNTNITRIMVYSHDTFGLGNLRRMLAICEQLLICWPKLSVLLVSGSPMIHEVSPAPKVRLY